jgi:hypothetical protein
MEVAIVYMPDLSMPDFFMFLGLGSAALLLIVAIIPERGEGDRSGRSGGFVSARWRARTARYERMGRVEEVLEVAEIVNAAADRLVAVLERSGADRLHDPHALREVARDELDHAALNVASLAFGTRMHEGSD